jgi:hypothetical protein
MATSSGKIPTIAHMPALPYLFFLRYLIALSLSLSLSHGNTESMSSLTLVHLLLLLEADVSVFEPQRIPCLFM